MGKRVVSEQNVSSRSIRKRKRSGGGGCKSTTVTATSSAPTSDWNDAEDSSSNDSKVMIKNCSIPANLSLKVANESPKPVYNLRPSLVNGTILQDLTSKPWRLGRPIGKIKFVYFFKQITNKICNRKRKLW